MIALAALAAVAAGVAVLRFSGARGLFAAAAGVVVGLGLSGAAFSAGLLWCGATGAGSDLALLALAALLFWRRPALAAEPPREPAPLWLTAACGLAALVVTALFVEHSVRYPEGGWDAIAIWNLRARALFGAPDRLAQVFTLELQATHPDYPLLLPGLVAHGWFALGTRTPFVPIAVSFLFAAAGAVALATAVSLRRGTALGLAAALLLLGTPDFLTLAWNQYADLKLAMLLLVAVALASEEKFAAAGLVAGLAAYTKNEGLIELSMLLLAVLLVSGRRAALRFVVGASLPLLLLAQFKLRWAPPNDLVAQTHASGLLRRLPLRVALVVRGLARQLIDFGHWGCALALVALCWIAGGRRSERTVSALFVALMLGVVFAIYLATPLEPVEHMRSSLDRLLFQLWPSILYATARLFHTSTTAKTASAAQPGQSPSTW